MTDTSNRGAADTAYALGKRVDGLEDRISLFIQKQVVVTEVRAGKVPVKVLGLRIECKSICNQWIDRFHDALYSLRSEICRRRQLFRRGISFGADTFNPSRLLFSSCTHFFSFELSTPTKPNALCAWGLVRFKPVDTSICCSATPATSEPVTSQLS